MLAKTKWLASKEGGAKGKCRILPTIISLRSTFPIHLIGQSRTIFYKVAAEVKQVLNGNTRKRRLGKVAEELAGCGGSNCPAGRRGKQLEVRSRAKVLIAGDEVLEAFVNFTERIWCVKRGVSVTNWG